ncbi:hypothetical protein ANN_15754 [Periplaneta americana]|uniref:Reverse transcriptase domain-containing protein n=1 Tax=Periplaneta americana TaxID=6978 RepID=A0ABQ8SH33_PERAM|nr:hypothetical protein ANN_15754 [Periplaneta americana]
MEFVEYVDTKYINSRPARGRRRAVLPKFPPEITWELGGVIVGGRRIKCIRFADDMTLLAEEETIIRDGAKCQLRAIWDENKCKQKEDHDNRKKNKEDRIRNEAVLERVGEERMMLKKKKELVGSLAEKKLSMKNALEGMVNGRRVLFKLCYGSLYAVMWLVVEPREFNLLTLPQRRITYVLEKLPSKYGVHSEEYLPIRTKRAKKAQPLVFTEERAEAGGGNRDAT